MNELENYVFSLSLAGCILSAILFVLFSQITVRKLRKNPETKDSLGIELTGSWDVFNVAGALSRPKWLNQKYNRSRLSSLVANPDVLYEHTTLFDRIFARVFYTLYVFSGTNMLILAILNALGLFA